MFLKLKISAIFFIIYAHFTDAKTFWKKVFFFCAIPSMLLTAYGAKKIHDKEGHFDQSKYVEYPYLNVRNKVIFVYSLFNALFLYHFN